MINPMDLSGKHILVTGASSGIGRSVSIMASRLGAKVSLIARNEDKIKETCSLMEGSDHDIHSFDLNEIDKIDALVKSIADNNGAIDGLVHCAGIGVNKPLKMTKPDFVVQMTRIHYFAYLELIRSASAKKRSNDGASYVGVTSVASIRGEAAQGAYAGAKGAMSAATHSLAKELSPRKIRVNTIAFGMVETDMYKGFLETGGNNDILLQDQYLGIIPVEYAANAICFLLSDASKYMTGGTMIYDAGDLS